MTMFLQAADGTLGGAVGIVFLTVVALAMIIAAVTAPARKQRAAKAAAAAAPAAPAAPAQAVEAAAPAPAAPGSAGEITLYSVPDKTAAMLMAIVADALKTPLNELRFLSIREIDEGGKSK